MPPSKLSVAVLLVLALAPTASASATCDAVTTCGARPDNATDCGPALSACVAAGGPCGAPFSTLVIPARSSFLCGSIDLSHTTNLTMRFEDGAAIFGSGDAALYPLQPALPEMNEPQQALQWRALLYARNTSGLTIEGPQSAVLDGLGWPWWANASTLVNQRPKLVEIVDSVDVLLRGMTFRNSPFWTTHTLYSQRVTFVDLTVLAPRAVGNTDGIDPDSCVDVLIDSCFIDVGDDGISLKSGYRVDPVSGVATLLPTRNVLIRNTTVLSRNVAIGSSTWGNITDVRIEGGRIGDDSGSSPWAIKVKTHVPYGGVVENITVSGTRIGRVAPNTWQQRSGGTAIFVLLTPYNTPAFPAGAPRPAATAFRNFTFEHVLATSAHAAGDLVAEAPFAIEGLTMRNVTIGAAAGHAPAWNCQRLVGTVAHGVSPPLPAACF